MAKYRNRIFLDPNMLASSGLAETRQGDLRVGLSSSDIPREVILTEDPTGWVQIRFTYPDEEKPVEQAVSNQVKLATGKYSGKIISITYPEALIGKAKEIIQILRKRLGEERAGLQHRNQVLNYGMISDILERKGEELLAIRGPQLE